jgi:hypothetical protein
MGVFKIPLLFSFDFESWIAGTYLEGNIKLATLIH